jgi:hypothetical protein
MSISGNTKKEAQLGMSIGKANYRLHRQVLFHLVQQCELDICFQCGKKIEALKELSIEHKVPWLDSEDPQSLFFDIGNIAFSHRKCNVAAKRKPKIKYTKKICPKCKIEFEIEQYTINMRQKATGQENFYCSARCAGNERK